MDKKAGIIFMGTPEFAVPSLEILFNKKYKVLAVVTQPDRPRGRGKKVIPSPVKKTAVEYGLPVLQPEKISADFIKELEELAPDVVVVAAYGKILPKSILEIPTLGCVNVHASLLPGYRGAAPIHRAVLNGETATGVTIMFMEEGMDTGDIILQKETEIFPNENTGSLYERLSVMGAELLEKALDKLLSGEISRRKQDSSRATYAPPLKREEEIINWEEDARHIHNQVRGMNPWPGAYTLWEGKRLKIWHASIVKKDVKGAPGEVISLEKDGIIVAAGSGALYIQELQLSGGKKMPADIFLRGNPIVPGTMLGGETR